jgi:hypothetical protein
MKVKLYNAHHEHIGTYAVGAKNFTVWLEECSDTFFAKGGHAELWNEREVYRFAPPVHSSRKLKGQIRSLAA